MPQKPVIFLAFANDKVDNANYLRNLADEKRSLEAIFQDRNCELIIKTNASIEDIFDTFRRNKDKITIFHYGGHADGYQLLLEKQATHIEQNEIAYGEGLVSFLGSQKNLQLAFFNGCSTRQFAENLVQMGVPAVLATDNSIADKVATELAIQFYTNLVSGFNLAQSFKDAVRLIVTKIGNKRGLYRTDLKENQMENPYQLKLNPNYPNAKDWQLFSDAVPIITGGFVSQNINKALIFPIYEAFAQYEPALLMLPDYKQKDEQKVANFVIETFPYPIGTHLRVLMANTPEMMKASSQRLKKIAQTAHIAGHLLWIILLSQWWEEQEQNPAFLLDLEAENAIKDYFQASIQENDHKNKWLLLWTLIQSFQENGTKILLSELAKITQELANPESELSNAVANLHELYVRLADYPKEGFLDLEQKNEQATADLAVVLKRLAFWIAYRIFPIKEISIRKIRTATPLFIHNLVSLDNRAREHSRDKKVAIRYFTDSYSVILFKGNQLTDLENEANLSISLSPFLFDENAFIENSVNSKLFIFKGLEKEMPCFSYLDTDESMEIDGEALKEMYTLFQRFKTSHLNF